MKSFLYTLLLCSIGTLAFSQSTVIYSTGFELSDTVGWGANSDLSFADMTADAEMGWALATGMTQTANTGPDMPQAGTHYAYFEHSCGLTSGGCPETEYSFVSPEITLDGTASSLSFYYLLYGDAVSATPSSLEVNILSGGISTSVFMEDNGFHTDGSTWSEAIIDLSAYDGQTIRIEFVGIEGTINNSNGDIGIDTLTVSATPIPTTDIPTLGEWGLLILLLSLLIMALVTIKQSQMSRVRPNLLKK